MLRIFMVGLGCLAVAGAQSDITREGAYWVRSLTGADSIPAEGRLWVNAGGSVKVRGAAETQLRYVLKARVKGRGEDEARRRLSAMRLQVSHAGDTAIVSVQPGAASGELDLRVPRTIREAAILTTDGSIELCDLDGAVQARTGGGPVRADRTRGDLRISTGGGNIDLGSVDGAVRATTGGGSIRAQSIGREATLETGGGDIVVQAAGGAVRATTGGGGIHIARAGGAVTANTGGGPIEVGQARGTVTTRNSGGPVKVGSADGVSCENAAGGVRLVNVSGTLRVSTAFGSILAQLLAGRPITDSFLTTANGDITVVIPANVAVSIRARNESADSVRRIVSEFPGISVRLEGSQVVAEGSINGGGPVLRIAGTGGTIFIKRQ